MHNQGLGLTLQPEMDKLSFQVISGNTNYIVTFHKFNHEQVL